LASRITEDVINRVREGEHAAFEVVYRELAPLVIGYFRSRGMSDPDALTNEVFIAMLKQAGRLTGGPSGLRTLIFSIAHARVVDELRSRSRQPVRIDYQPELDRRVSESAEHAAVLTLSTERISQLLDRLPADQRNVIALRVIADLSIDQVAELMSRSPGAIKQLQRRGLLALRELLAQPDVTSGPGPAMTQLP
jgi:RNA polymerase sigma-70 factor (ECF subfamily)